MKEEIINKIKKCLIAGYDVDIINQEEMGILWNYITNLQEENERYKKLFEGKERFSKIMPDDMDFIVMSKTDYDRQVDDIELVALELRSRIDKAIEYIKEKYNCELFQNKKLLNILQGEDTKESEVN